MIAPASAALSEPATAAPAPGDPRQSRPFRVLRREQEAADVVGLWLAPADGDPLPPWQPGAHLDLVLAPDLVRQYSLCGDPADGSCWRIAVHRAPDGRGGSAAVFERLVTGSAVTVRGPRNAFPLRPSPRYRFIAGGIGITPILPMLAAAEASGADWDLVYGGRSRAGMPFLPQLRGYGDRVRICPQDETGLLPVSELVGVPQPDTLVYCCGPAPLLAAVEEAMRDWPQALVLERFAPAGEPAAAPAGASSMAPAGEPAPAGGTAFEVELAASGRVLTVGPDCTVLAALERAGVPVLSSCREGVCGSCEVDVLAGTVEHRDRLLTAQEQAANQTMLVCVSRSAGPRLVLDL